MWWNAVMVLIPLDPLKYCLLGKCGGNEGDCGLLGRGTLNVIAMEISLFHTNFYDICDSKISKMYEE